jgi:glycosyltransferase involved in cell wall biosynthesis
LNPEKEYKAAMQLGIINFETWSFFREIYADLEKNHSVSRFEWRVKSFPILNQRLNDWSLNRNLMVFLEKNDVVFFEWASEYLSVASHLPKRCGIVTRLHRYEMYGLVDQINWNNVDKIILVSQVKKKEFLERFPDQGPKLFVIPEAIDTSAFSFHPKPFTGKFIPPQASL